MAGEVGVPGGGGQGGDDDGAGRDGAEQQQQQQAHLRHQQTGSGRQPTFYKSPPRFPQNQVRTLQS